MSIDNPKFMELTTENDNLVALFTDSKHQLFGRLAALVQHDWMEYGEYYLSIPNYGELVKVSDGMCGNPPSPIELFYRLNDWQNSVWDEKKHGVKSLKEKYLELGVGDIEKLKAEYRALFREELA